MTDTNRDARQIAAAFRQIFSEAMKINEALSQNDSLNDSVPENWPLPMSADEFAHECAAMADHYEAIAKVGLPDGMTSPCKFVFDDSPSFDGFTDGTKWNGFDNVWVTPEVRDEIVAYFKSEFGEGYASAEPDGDITGNEVAGENGLISLAYGFTTQIVKG